MAVYRDQIEKAIAPLLTAGFQVVSVLERVEVFGNTVVVLASDTLKVRLVSDRGQILADVSEPGTSGWYSLRDVLVAGGKDVLTGPWATPDEAVQKIQTEGQVVVRLLADTALMANLPRRA